MACSVVKILAVSSVLALASTCEAFMTAPSLRPATSALRAAGSRQGRCSSDLPSMVLTPDRRTASAPTGYGDKSSQPPAQVRTRARAPRRRRGKLVAAPPCVAKLATRGQPLSGLGLGRGKSHLDFPLIISREHVHASAHVPGVNPPPMHLCATTPGRAAARFPSTC